MNSIAMAHTAGAVVPADGRRWLITPGKQDRHGGGGGSSRRAARRPHPGCDARPRQRPRPVIGRDADADFAHTLADLDACRYASLAVRLPRLIRSGHALSGSRGETQNCQLLAKSYLLATRMLIKMDEQQLGWTAVDPARQLAKAGGDILAVAESARQLAVLARGAGWRDEALSIALSAADHPDLRDTGRAGAAARGLLIQSATYTVARRGDKDGMRQLTDEAAGIAKDLGGERCCATTARFQPAHRAAPPHLRRELRRPPLAALAAARSISLKELPSIERRSRALKERFVPAGLFGSRSRCRASSGWILG
ncbi:hypothetical protein [Streptomyces sp.]|uniref:hypothetical protein n=1 Tax=Streptomyces sp. TaxID=1931 RepID=UPI0028125630|nr:hypothetical protein [Streptomyces sp.]